MQDWTKIISAGVGPIIVISACGLLCLAFYNRLAAVVTRMRAFHREQLDEQEALARLRAAGSVDEIAIVRHQEVQGMLRVQIEHIGRRARLINRTLGCLLLAIVSLAVCSMALGLSTLWPGLVYAAVSLFILGLALLVLGVISALFELHSALDPVDLESKFIADMAEEFSALGAKEAEEKIAKRG
jgi:hypothetical protein